VGRRVGRLPLKVGDPPGIDFFDSNFGSRGTPPGVGVPLTPLGWSRELGRTLGGSWPDLPPQGVLKSSLSSSSSLPPGLAAIAASTIVAFWLPAHLPSFTTKPAPRVAKVWCCPPLCPSTCSLQSVHTHVHKFAHVVFALWFAPVMFVHKFAPVCGTQHVQPVFNGN